MLKKALSFHRNGRLAEAATLYRKILNKKPADADALHLLGVLESQRNNALNAIKLIDRAIDLRPKNSEFLCNRGIVLAQLKRFADAIASFDRALALKPNSIDALSNRGFALHEQKRFDDALASYNLALAMQPNHSNTLINRGSTLQCLQQFDEALISYERALISTPENIRLLGARLFCKMNISNWLRIDEDFQQLARMIAAGRNASEPFPVLASPLSATLQKACSETYVREKHPPSSVLPPLEWRPKRNRIRLGYFSADFHNHATAYLSASLFERHNRAQFEVIAFSYGSPKQDKMKERLKKGFDRFMEVGTLSDIEIALLSRNLEIDIAIDLKGFTQDCRPGIFALRAAPIQINYLGYPGTMGAEYIDYLIADPILIPKDQQQHYREKIIYLPHSYQVNDSKREVTDKRFTRADCGLAEQGFVFCCFNNSYKILPQLFDIWMRLLKSVEGSVLWLFESNPSAVTNLCREARDRGIASERLIFGKPMELSEHVARYRLADLFLDTVPCNAHTTASDALWAGLPVLTCLGQTFAGRVAASLLTAVGMADLISANLAEYEAVALELATNPQRLASLRQRLSANRLTHPLFDTALFTKHIETAYVEIWNRFHSRNAPDHIYIRSDIERACGST